MNWFFHILQKEAKHRRYKPEDRVRYFTKQRGGNIVLTPHFYKGKIKDFNSETRRYIVEHDDGTEIDVHPRNIVPDSIGMQNSVGPAQPTEELVEPFPR